MKANLLLFAGLFMIGISAAMLFTTALLIQNLERWGIAYWIGIAGCAMTVYFLVRYA